MPLYEYQCDSCSHRFEVIQKFSDAPIQTCPSCGGPVKKLPSSPAIQFKGSGWYITDYARKGQTGSKSEQSGTSDSGDSKSTPSTDSSGSGSSSSTSSSSSKDSSSKDSSSKASSGKDSSSKD